MKNSLLILCLLVFSLSANPLPPHEKATHFPAILGSLGAIIELEDGSIWNIEEGDRHKVLKWLITDRVFLTTNEDWFSAAPFKMYNCDTHVSVKCTMTLAPTYNGAHSHWVAGINFFTQEVYLEDGSTWQISGFDSGNLSKWQVNHTVMIGVNDSFLSTTKPYVLINTDLLNHVRASVN